MPEPTCTVIVLAVVCGHEEGEHEDVTFTITVCKGCVPMGETFNKEHPGAHAFTALEPLAEENAHA